jgi:UDP-GlcNAc:undecaprenyl-phosphate GlcNAc-1-phosphate transferase
MDTMKRRTLSGRSALIYGAGRGGEILLREILHNHQLKIKPLGFIDDDPIKSGKKLQGYPILGTSSDLHKLTLTHNVSGLLVSFRSEQENLGRLDSVKRFCKENGLFLKQFSVCLEDMNLTP